MESAARVFDTEATVQKKWVSGLRVCVKRSGVLRWESLQVKLLAVDLMVFQGVL